MGLSQSFAEEPGGFFFDEGGEEVECEEEASTGKEYIFDGVDLDSQYLFHKYLNYKTISF